MSIGGQTSTVDSSSAGESPSNPSISDGLFELGTTLPKDCESYDVDSDDGEDDVVTVDPEDPAGSVSSSANDAPAYVAQSPNAATADGFCSKLVYNTETGPTDGFDSSGGLDVVQPNKDQDIRSSEVVDFDGMMVTSISAYSLSTCAPWCLHAATELAYITAMDTLDDADGEENSDTDLFRGGGEDACDGERDSAGCGWQTYSAGTILIQPSVEASQAGLDGEFGGNGWLFPVYDTSLAVVITGDDPSTPIDEATEGPVALNKTMVEKIIEAAEGNTLREGAIGSICAFTPDDVITINAPQANVCEVSFSWAGPGEDSFQNPCTSPTYACQADVWLANLVCSQALSQCPLSDSFDSTENFARWYYVLAPSGSDCSGLQEPGFVMEDPNKDPYLAMDFDAYEPVTAPAGVTSYETTLDYTHGLLPDNVINTYNEAPGGIEEVEDYDREIFENGGDVREANGGASYALFQDDRVEPNTPEEWAVYEGSTPTGWASDHLTSRSYEVSRANDDCFNIDRVQDANQEFSSIEGEQGATEDPWRLLIDNQIVGTVADSWESSVPTWSGFGGTSPSDPGASHQDASNSGTPDQYWFSGKVGIFTDLDDDGNYEQSADNEKYTGTFVNGAYELAWDMRVKNHSVVNDDGINETERFDVDLESGCRAGFAQISHTKQMNEAGYGALTGVVQAVYLQENTTWWTGLGGLSQQYTDENNVYLFMSQAMQEIYRAGQGANYTVPAGSHAETQQNLVRGVIQDTLDKIPALQGASPDGNTWTLSELEDANPADDSDGVPDLHFPGEDLEPAKDNDFGGQCSSATGTMTNNYEFVHDCVTLDCTGDTIVTQYVADVNTTDGILGGAGDIPAFTVDGAPVNIFGIQDTSHVNDPNIDANETHELAQLFDVDPLDNNPNRNEERSSAPPRDCSDARDFYDEAVDDGEATYENDCGDV